MRFIDQKVDKKMVKRVRKEKVSCLRGCGKND